MANTVNGQTIITDPTQRERTGVRPLNFTYPEQDSVLRARVVLDTATDFIIDDPTLTSFDGTLCTTDQTGTIAYTNGSTAVTGTSTLFTTALAIGDALYDTTNSSLIGVVASITSDTALVLTANSTATTHSGGTFRRRTKASGRIFIVGLEYTCTGANTIIFKSKVGSATAVELSRYIHAANGGMSTPMRCNHVLSSPTDPMGSLVVNASGAVNLLVHYIIAFNANLGDV